MSLIPLSGHNDEAMSTPAGDARDLITDLAGNSPDFDGDGRVFELLELQVTNEHASQVATFEAYDANEGGGPGAATQQLTLMVGPTDTVERSWKLGTGPRFTIGLVGAVTNGLINIGGVTASGVLH